MKRSKTILILGIAALMLFAVSGIAGGNNATTTAQSIMIDANNTQTLAIVGTQTWKYDLNAAALLFSNKWDEDTPAFTSAYTDTVTSTQKDIEGTAPASENPCTPAAPAIPDVPDPLANKLLNNQHPGKEDVVGKNQCNFLDGDDLVGDSYTQDATSTTTSCTYYTYQQNGPKYTKKTNTVTRTDTYEYNYVIASLQDSYQPFTAWDLVSETNPDGTAHFDVSALIAGESVQVSKQNGTKYSFSLLQDDGSVRILNACVAADGGTPVCGDYLLGTLTYEDRNASGPTPDLNYMYSANALDCNGTACGSLINGESALNILNGVSPSPDVFPGNDNGGSNGQALAAVLLCGIGFDLAEGSHTLAFTAKVKENNGTLDSVGVTATVNVVTPGCGGN